MNKIIAVIAIVLAFTLGTIFSADIATAVKPSEDDNANTIPLNIVGGGTPLSFRIQLDVSALQGSSLLYYGDELCTLLWNLNQVPSVQWYIEFAGETLVRDKCGGNLAGNINLIGNFGDQVFQKGDFLILQNNQEVFRSQTP